MYRAMLIGIVHVLTANSLQLFHVFEILTIPLGHWDKKIMLENDTRALAGVAQLVGALSHKPKGRQFNSQSGHMPRLWVPSLVGGI